jgi:hypothetical protein
MTEAMVLNFLEPDSLLLWADDCCLEEEGFRRIEERDHHEREGLLGVGTMDREGVWGEKIGDTDRRNE